MSEHDDEIAIDQQAAEADALMANMEYRGSNEEEDPGEFEAGQGGQKVEEESGSDMEHEDGDSKQESENEDSKNEGTGDEAAGDEDRSVAVDEMEGGTPDLLEGQVR